jgi:hypothetical protein
VNFLFVLNRIRLKKFFLALGVHESDSRLEGPRNSDEEGRDQVTERPGMNR